MSSLANFRDRTEAGRKLAQHLASFKNRSDVLVLGVPRGGIPVALEVAAALDALFDIFVIRKLGVPGQEELAFGAIASSGVRILDDEVVNTLAITSTTIEQVTRAESQELARREKLYRRNRAPLYARSKIVLLIDDGIATGSSLRAGVQALRQLQPASIIIAAPVAPPATIRMLAQQADDVVCVAKPENFRGVGQFYQDFSQMTDDEVIERLQAAGKLGPESSQNPYR